MKNKISKLFVELQGGLGNQLFQIANGYSLAKEHQLQLILPNDWKTKPERPPIWDNYLKSKRSLFNLESLQILTPCNWVDIQEDCFSYRPIELPKVKRFFSNKVEFYKITGFYQSSHYFNKYKDEVRTLLQIPDELKLKALDFFKSHKLRDQDNVIGIHVRRGDYLETRNFHQVTTVNYFKRARMLIEKRIGKSKVIWVTDDQNWVENNLSTKGDLFTCSDPLIDFCILSICQNLVISNSSFSWWAAWLEPIEYRVRNIFCPNQWFGASGPKDYETIYESNWNRIPV